MLMFKTSLMRKQLLAVLTMTTGSENLPLLNVLLHVKIEETH